MRTPLLSLAGPAALLSGLALAGTGCTVGGDGRDAGESSRALATVALGFTRSPDGAPRLDADAHFARYPASLTGRADPPGAPPLALAALLGLPSEGAIPLDGCRLTDGAAEADAVGRALEHAGGTIQLLSAGRLTVQGPGATAELPARHYPELTPLLSGVIYGADESNELPLEPGASYELRGEGSEDVAPFVARVAAPRAFPSLTLAPWRRGTDLELRWGDPNEQNDPNDPILITVAFHGRGGGELRCRVRDTGSFRIGAEQLPVPLVAATLDVVATRTRRASFSVFGLGMQGAPGEVSIALRDAASIPVRE